MSTRKDRSPPIYEADLDPETRAPRIRLTFANGWAVSIVLRGRGPCDYQTASVATMASRKVVHAGETEASPDEVSTYLAQVMNLPPWPAGEPLDGARTFLERELGRYRK